eukprot:7019158-Pyramimonas_sp.AAC.1
MAVNVMRTPVSMLNVDIRSLRIDIHSLRARHRSSLTAQTVELQLPKMCFSPSVWLCTRALGTES